MFWSIKISCLYILSTFKNLFKIVFDLDFFPCNLSYPFVHTEITFGPKLSKKYCNFGWNLLKMTIVRGQKILYLNTMPLLYLRKYASQVLDQSNSSNQFPRIFIKMTFFYQRFLLQVHVCSWTYGKVGFMLLWQICDKSRSSIYYLQVTFPEKKTPTKSA